MKIFLTLSLLLSVSISRADFIDAQKNYEQGDFAPAFKEFITLAKFGNIKSQHNVAVMFAKGEGVKQDFIQAYAWSKISDSKQDYIELTKVIQEQLSQEQLSLAKELATKYFKQYAHINSKVLLGPISQNNQVENQHSRFKSIDRTAPNYPMTMASKGLQGWVDVIFMSIPIKSIKAAIKSAKKAGWDLTELQQQKEMIKEYSKNKA